MGGFLHVSSASYPMFMLEIVHVAHINTAHLHEIRTGDLLSFFKEVSLCVYQDQNVYAHIYCRALQL